MAKSKRIEDVIENGWISGSEFRELVGRSPEAIRRRVISGDMIPEDERRGYKIKDLLHLFGALEAELHDLELEVAAVEAAVNHKPFPRRRPIDRMRATLEHTDEQENAQ